jgi:enoyl-CoA hydratase
MVSQKEYKNILYRPGKIARITLNRPAAMNALSYDLLAEMQDALIVAERDPECRVIIINGAGRCFSTGYDLGGYAHPDYGDVQVTEEIKAKDHVVQRHENYFTIWNLLKPVIAQVHGYCLAGASELAAMCDVTIVAEDTIIGYPPVRAMSTPDTPYPAWLFNIKKAKLYCFTGDPITGKEAVEWGFATMAVPADQLEEVTTKIAERIAIVPTELMCLQKEEINRIYDIMGFTTSIEWSSKIHDLAGKVEVVQQFHKIAHEKGHKAALQWRDGPYGDVYRPKK